MSAGLIELQEITVSFDKDIKIGPVTFSVNEGELVCIVGPNGSGKSTILKSIIGLVKINKGKLNIFNKKFDKNKNLPLNLKRKIGFLFQQHAFSNDLPFTVMDIISFGINIKKKSHRMELINSSLKIMGLYNYEKRLYKELSGGEKQKVHLARLIAQDPVLFLLDEPTTSLDIDYKSKLLMHIDMLHYKLKKTIIMVTHYIDEIPERCSKIIFLKDGRILEEGHPDQILNEKKLNDLYSCPVQLFSQENKTFALRR